MSMFPIDALHGYSLPRQNSVPIIKVERKQPRSIKTIFRRPSGFKRKGSKVGSASSRTNSLVDGEIDGQEQCSFFSRLPLEIRFQIYEEVIGEELYHFRTSKQLYSFRCPRRQVVNKARRLIIMECKFGHPWTERPMSLEDARKLQDQPPETRAAMMQTCKLAYTETFELLYKRSKFAFEGAESLLMLGKAIKPAAIERILVVELRAPDMLVWNYRLTHPRENCSGINEWMECLSLLQHMTSLRSLYVIVPSSHASFTGPERKHDLETERDFLGRFSELRPISDFVVWIAWYRDNGEGYPHGDTEADRYAFKLVRFPGSWPQAAPTSGDS